MPIVRVVSRLLPPDRRFASAVAVALLAATATAAAADAARSRSVDDSAHLHLSAHHGGSALKEIGEAKGTLPGTVRVSLVLHTHIARASFTLDVRGGGSISGRGSSALKTGKGGYASFGGAIAVTGGTGRYAHVSGSGGLYGTINRVTDSMTVRVTGHLRY